VSHTDHARNIADNAPAIAHHAKNAADAVAGITAFAAIMKWLPAIAALMSIIWYTLQIYWKIRDRMAIAKDAE